MYIIPLKHQNPPDSPALYGGPRHSLVQSPPLTNQKDGHAPEFDSQIGHDVAKLSFVCISHNVEVTLAVWAYRRNHRHT